jgi:two-component system, cell cycle sensor histidine kinase and response regulator CckA
VNILIVDDQPINQKLLHATLEAAGYTVAKAADGIEALQLLESHGADAIISDILMPRMDGYRLCSEVRKRKEFEHVPFIHYTATYTSPGDEKFSADLGADVFLRKPAPAEEIIGALRRLIGKGHKVRATPAITESDVMKEYSERLVAKLEHKNLELARTLKELNSERARLRQLLEHSPAVIYALKIEGQSPTPVSENIKRLLGVTVAESSRYEWWLESLHPEDRDRVLAVLAKSLTEGGYSTEYRIRHKDGSYHWVEDNNRVVRDETGQPKESVGVWTDITERHEREDRLREQAKLLDLAQDAIMVRDMEDRVEFWNHGAEKLYGWTAAEVHGRKASGFLYDDEPAATAAARAGVIENGKWTGECKHTCKDGGTVMVRSRWTLVRDELAAPKSILIINTDATEQKKLETHLLRAQRLESIGTLASGVAHDLNNILSPILMCAEVLKGKPMAGNFTALVSMIEENAKRGANVVKQVLTFARGIEGERVVIKPSHLIQEMIDIAQKTFPKTIDLRSRYPEDIWSVQVDPTQLHQVLLNLSINARDAMPNGGSLTIGAENFEVDEHYAFMTPGAKPGPHVMIRVTDTGVGMSRATIDKIFDPFFTTKEIGKGTGLGLSTVLGIVKSHGGFISAYSDIGTGTTFKIFLPAKVSKESSQESKVPSELLEGNGELVLVVDDEPGVVQMTKMILENRNYRVLTAEDGPDALSPIAQQTEPIKIVLTDMSMPFMDGIALIRAIKKMKPATMFIASTGQGEKTRMGELESLGVRNFLTKPYDTQTLLTTVRDTLNGAPTNPVH